ncbi:hypothetical protein E2C01_015346 [Portunus trituberculatus]|uniref:Uncharacterized protein n=1 Tax=Portunus trituberculatus TaxID=210409 RepID=A0A5B7DMR7_PORTR|nr:hypothetical protein [Portunus trituberculatus]
MIITSLAENQKELERVCPAKYYIQLPHLSFIKKRVLVLLPIDVIVPSKMRLVVMEDRKE